MQLRRITATTCLLSTASAFYPYTLPNKYDDAGYIQARRAPTRHDDEQLPRLTLNLRRRPVRRSNEYNIITAETPSAPNSAGVDQDGTDFSYFSTFNFGTSNEAYHMLIDSGASNTWLMGSQCDSDACAAHNTFGPGDSSTLQVTGNTFGISYGTGSVGGVIARDTAHFAGLSFPLSFGLGENVSSEFLSYPMDGILGLGRGDGTSPAIQAPTFMSALKSAGVVKVSMFGLNLWRTSDGGSNDGEITLGAADSSKYSGDLSYTPTIANNDGFWEIPIGDAAVDGKSIHPGLRTGLVDSGTSFILMPPGDAQKLFAQISGAEQSDETYTLPCDWKGTVSITFSDVQYDISYKDIVGRTTSGGQCSSNIIGRQTFGSTQWLVGDVFLKNVYTVFDLDNNRVGFGMKAGASDTASSSQTSLVAPVTMGSSSGMPSTSPVPFPGTKHPQDSGSTKSSSTSTSKSKTRTPSATQQSASLSAATSSPSSFGIPTTTAQTQSPSTKHSSHTSHTSRIDTYPLPSGTNILPSPLIPVFSELESLGRIRSFRDATITTFHFSLRRLLVLPLDSDGYPLVSFSLPQRDSHRNLGYEPT